MTLYIRQTIRKLMPPLLLPIKAVIFTSCGTPSADLRPSHPAPIVIPIDPISSEKTTNSSVLEKTWEELQQLDGRLFVDRKNIERHLSEDEIALLRSDLYQFVSAGQRIEALLKNKYGIDIKTKKMQVIIPGPWNNAMIGFSGEMDILVGNPDEHQYFFAFPENTYAHEMGHFLSYFDEKGKNRYAGAENSVTEMYKIDKSKLNRKGDLSTKYLGPIPYHLLPPTLVFPKNPDDSELLYSLNELLADKISLELCGAEMSREHFLLSVKHEAQIENPFHAYLRYLVLAREFGFTEEAKMLHNKIKQYERLWISTISTEDLLSGMGEFFRHISLKKQSK